MFEVEAAEAWDIDEELDFEIVDFLLRGAAKPSHEPSESQKK